MALYARTLLTRETVRSLSSLSFCGSRRPILLALFLPHTSSIPSFESSISLSLMRPFLPDASTLRSSSRHFPISLTGATTLFVLLLRHGGAFECNHQPALWFLLFFPPSFFLPSYFFVSPARFDTP